MLQVLDSLRQTLSCFTDSARWLVGCGPTDREVELRRLSPEQRDVIARAQKLVADPETVWAKGGALCSPGVGGSTYIANLPERELMVIGAGFGMSGCNYYIRHLGPTGQTEITTHLDHGRGTLTVSANAKDLFETLSRHGSLPNTSTL